VSHLVFADPDHQAARALLAITFEQLATPRRARLAQRLSVGAQELSRACRRPASGRDAGETLAALRTEQLWDVLGIRLNGPKAEVQAASCSTGPSRTGETFVLTLENLRADLCRGAQAARPTPACLGTRHARRG